MGSLDPAGPSLAEERFAAAVLSPREQVLWRRMSGPDRRHAVDVARRVQQNLGDAEANEAVLAAALLHDVGKIEAGLGTAGRVFATLCAGAAGWARAAGWHDRPGWLGRVGRYTRHGDIGAELLTAAGSHPTAVAWAAQHHRDPDHWTHPTELAAALSAADIY